MSEAGGRRGMTAKQAMSLEFGIIGFCIVAAIMIFQPFSMTVFSIGAGLIVLGGLAFNLVPFCRPGVPFSAVLKAAGIVLAILVVVVLLALGSTELYTVYLQHNR